MRQVEAYNYKAKRLPKHLDKGNQNLAFVSLYTFSFSTTFSLFMANNFLERKPFKPPFEIIERKTKTINIKYKDCMRNHAPQLGVNVVDGCGEFTPKGRTSETRNGDLDCEACGCHRNFHRKEATKKISLTFIENEQVNWFRFHSRPFEMNNEQKQTENEEMNERIKKPKN